MKKKFWVLLMTLCVLFGVMYTPVSYADDISIDKQTQNEIFEKVSDSAAVQPTVLGGTIADGTYYIKNCYSNKYLTASGGSIAAGTSVVQQEKLTGDAALPQLWRIYHLGNEQYTIRPFHKLDMTMGRTAQDIDLAYRGATDEELTDLAKWRMTQASTGWYLSLYGYASNYVMSLATASSNNGTRITFAQKSNSASKMWILESIPTAPTGVALYNTQSWIAPRSKVSFRASVYSGNTIDQSVTWSSSNKNIARVNIIGLVTGVSKGTATITARSTYNTNWSASYTVNVGEMPNGTYYIKSMQSGKVVDIKDSNTAAGESIHQFDFEGTNDQKWIFELQQDGYYTIKSVHSNLYLSVKDNSSSSGAEVVQNPDGNADGQRWAIIKTSSGAYKIKAKCAGDSDLCLKKGTYIFYPNKLVHMTYTNDSTYDDDWYIFKCSLMLTLNLYYDRAFNARYDDSVGLINSFKSEVSDIFNKNFLLQINYNNLTLYTSLADSCKISRNIVINRNNINDDNLSMCPANPYRNSICPNHISGKDNCTSWLQIYRNFIASYAGSNTTTSVLFTGNRLYDNSGNICNRSYFGYNNGIMLENIYENSTEYHTRMLPVFVHEISHAIGAPDHYHEPIDDEGTCRSGDICSKCGTNKRPEFCIMNQGGNIGNLSEISRDRIYCSWCISDISKHLNDHH